MRVSASKIVTEVAAFVLAGLMVSSAGAQQLDEQRRLRHIDPMVALQLRTPSCKSLVPGKRLVLVELVSDDDAPAARLASRGLAWVYVDNTLVHYRRWRAAYVDLAALQMLSLERGVERVKSTPCWSPSPTNRTRSVIDYPALRRGGNAGHILDGQGTLVADLDSIVDIYHPAFFFGDAGAYEWVDANDNGRFDADVDGIDLNSNGEIDDSETGVGLSAEPLSFRGFPRSEVRGRPWDPGLDWVYLDTNNNNTRDHGEDKGFDDMTPAFGEALFTPDDVDGDGVIGLAERFIRLGTSKFRKVFVQGASGRYRTYERGVNLSSSPIQIDPEAAYQEAYHGTGVLGILLGDLGLPHRKWAGVAPGAEAIASGPYDGALLALEEDPDVMLHEYAPQIWDALDGTDGSALLIDESTLSDQVSHVCPAGNYGSGNRHAALEIAADASVTVPLQISTDLGGVYLSFHLVDAGETAVGVVLRSPSGVLCTIGDAEDGDDVVDGVYCTWQRGATEAGTGMVNIALSSDRDFSDPLEQGTWSVEVSHSRTETTLLHAFVGDEYGFQGGAEWAANVSRESTLGTPATARDCITLGAVPGHLASESAWFDGEELEGEARGYSSAGPRIDGLERLDVMAPDNPLAPWPEGPFSPSDPSFGEAPAGSYTVFGGTSGAGPHVAAVALLLVQVGVHGSAIRDAIRASAVPTAMSGELPNAFYGYGILNARAALHLEASTAVSVQLASSVNGELSIATDSRGGSVQWDLDYDGVWDTEWLPLSEPQVARGSAIKVRVVDVEGNLAYASIGVSEPILGSDAGVEQDAGLTSSPDAGAEKSTHVKSGCGTCMASHRDAESGGIAVVAFLMLVFGLNGARALGSAGSRRSWRFRLLRRGAQADGAATDRV